MTIICKTHGFAFYHIPKTGGCAITWGLAKAIPEWPDPPPAEEVFGIESRCKGHKNYGWQHIYHEKMGSSIMHPLFIPQHLEGLRVFSFYRNPFDRLLSLYWWKTKGGVKFKDFVMNFAPKGLLTQQIDYCHPKHLSFFGRFENLNDDFKKVCKELCIKPVDLPIVNKYPRADAENYREQYDEEMVQAVRKIYAGDIEVLGYAF